MLRSVQYLRGIAATMIVVYHAINALQINRGYGEGTANVLSAGVDIFFVISGFIMVYTTATGVTSPHEFYRKRIVRIVPLYWLTTTFMLGLLLAVPAAFNSSVFDLGHVIASYLFYPWPHPVRHDDEPLVLPGWTLNYEMFFYLLYGAMLLLRPLSRRVAALCTVFPAIVLVGVLTVPTPQSALDFYTSSIILEFACGGWLAYLFVTKVAERGIRNALLYLGLGIAALLVGTVGDSHVPRAILYGLPAALIMRGVVGLDRWIGDYRLLRMLGDASYSIYLVHFIAQAALTMGWRHLVGFASPGGNAVFVSMQVTVGVLAGMITYGAVERPLTVKVTAWSKLLVTRPATVA